MSNNTRKSMGIIYKVTSPSGKFYIGQTFRNLEQRKKEHIWRAFRASSFYKNYKFYNSIRKYGPENFFWEILHSDVENLLKLNMLEAVEIKKHDSYKNGYNSTLGGDGVRGISHSKEIRSKISKSHFGKKLSEETKRKISISKMGNKNPNFGKNMLKIVKKQISEKLKGKSKSKEHKENISFSKMGKKNPNFKRGKLTIENIKEIKKMLRSGMTHRKISSLFEVNSSCITRINTGESHSDVK